MYGQKEIVFFRSVMSGIFVTAFFAYERSSGGTVVTIGYVRGRDIGKMMRDLIDDTGI